MPAQQAIARAVRFTKREGVVYLTVMAEVDQELIVEDITLEAIDMVELRRSLALVVEVPETATGDAA